MKSIRGAFEDIVSFKALLAAFRAYRAGKRRRPSVAAFEADMEKRLLELSDQLSSGGYRHGPYRLLSVRDPKPRLIAVAPVRDRIVHTAVYRALAPFFERRFVSTSYACLPHRGSHRAILRSLALQRGHAFVMHLDIARFFPSVEHARLLGLLQPHIRDPKTVALLEHILATGDELYRRPEVRGFFGLAPLSPSDPACGLPIGNLTSQWWGNLYLDGLDHFVKESLRVKGYERYMDDAILFGNSRADLAVQRNQIRQWLLEERGLRLNPTKGHIRSCLLPQYFLGYRLTRAGVDLGPRAVRRFRKRRLALLEMSHVARDAAWQSLRGAMVF
jgi:hypothetical protein